MSNMTIQYLQNESSKVQNDTFREKFDKMRKETVGDFEYDIINQSIKHELNLERMGIDSNSFHSVINSLWSKYETKWNVISIWAIDTFYWLWLYYLEKNTKEDVYNQSIDYLLSQKRMLVIFFKLFLEWEDIVLVINQWVIWLLDYQTFILNLSSWIIWAGTTFLRFQSIIWVDWMYNNDTFELLERFFTPNLNHMKVYKKWGVPHSISSDIEYTPGEKTNKELKDIYPNSDITHKNYKSKTTKIVVKEKKNLKKR